MRIKIGTIVNADADVNLADLKPLDRIVAAAINAYHNTAMYKRRYAESEEKRQEQYRRVRETVIDSILAILVSEMEANTLLNGKDDKCIGLLLGVPNRYKDYLNDIVDAHEFAAYNITIVPPSAVLSKFANPPHLLLITSIGG